MMLSVKLGGIKCHSCVFGMIPPGIEPQSPATLANTLTIMPMSLYDWTLLLLLLLFTH